MEVTAILAHEALHDRGKLLFLGKDGQPAEHYSISKNTVILGRFAAQGPPFLQLYTDLHMQKIDTDMHVPAVCAPAWLRASQLSVSCVQGQKM